MIAKPLIVGIGSRHGDDQAGWLVIERLRELGWPAEVARVCSHPLEILHWAERTRALVACDACVGSGSLGAYRVWNWPMESWPTAVPRNTHDLALPAVLELGQMTGCVPAQVLVWTIEGETWSQESKVSAAVSEAAALVAAKIDQEFGDA